MSKKYHVFLSHNSADKPAIEAIANRLANEAGLRPFLDKWHLVPGAPWQEGLSEALEASQTIAVFIGPSGISPWHNEEVRAAINLAVGKRDEYRVIPVLLPGADPGAVEMFLSARTWVDFRSGLEDEGAFNRLVAGIKGEPPESGSHEFAAALGETFTEITRRGTAPIASKFLVPFPHNPDFVGRETELSSLHEMMQQGQSIVGIRPTVLVGLGGIGKTQLAVEYAHTHRDDYSSGVFWLNAINPLLIEFSDLAEKLEMADRDTPRDKAARKAWDYLDSHPDSLVIFDNVLEPSELNVPFSPDLVPANLRCRTLFTTRQRDFPRTFQPFEVKVLPETAAMRLLLRSRPAVLEEHHHEWGWARIVCAELGWLPLALELAAAYLGAYPEVSVTGYLERLRAEGSLETVDASEVSAVELPTRVEEILKAAAAGNLELKHQVAVSATLQTQWKRLGNEDAKLLFRAAGQFPEASWIPISRLDLLTGIETEAKIGHPSPLSVALKKLHAVSLIEELSDDRLRLHPLVQEYSARLSPDSFRLELAERVTKEFNDLLRLQERVITYGVVMVLEDVRTGSGFCASEPESKLYSQISILERVLDRQTHNLRGWDL